MTWQWVAVLIVVVLAWTVYRITEMWQTVTMYKYAPDAIKLTLGKQVGIEIDERER